MTANNEPVQNQSDPRYLFRVAIFIGPFQNEIQTNYSINISCGGIFMETCKTLPVDTKITIKFRLPDSDTVIDTNARVAWINEPGALKKESLPQGMGLQFIDLSLDDLHTIREFLNKCELVPVW